MAKKEPKQPKRGRGRPVKHPLAEPIDATPEEVARTVLRAKPKETWRFEEESGRKSSRKPS